MPLPSVTKAITRAVRAGHAWRGASVRKRGSWRRRFGRGRRGCRAILILVGGGDPTLDTARLASGDDLESGRDHRRQKAKR